MYFILMKYNKQCKYITCNCVKLQGLACVNTLHSFKYLYIFFNYIFISAVKFYQKLI